MTFSLGLNAQDLDWLIEASKISAETIIADKIRNNEPWKAIYKYGREELKVSEDSLQDIFLTLNLEKLNRNSTVVDSFFQLIIDSSYSEFPFRVSGKLLKSYYKIPKPNTSSSHISIWDPNNLRKSLNPKIAELIRLDDKILLPQLINYLENDAATRLCIGKTPIRPWENRKSRYLSISDVALELIQIKTYCDFYSQYHYFPLKLFSNQEVKEKTQIIDDIKTLCNNTMEINSSERVSYFLNSKSSYDYSYKLTCDNLLFAGDTINAKNRYIELYEQTRGPCGQDFKLGEILLELGDRRMLSDCDNKIFNYKCIIGGLGRNCIEFYFSSNEASLRDDVFAEIIATEPHSNYRKGDREEFIWNYIFQMIPNSDAKLIKTLVEIMSIQDSISSLNNQFTDPWKDNYPDEFVLNYRVCDFALMKYLETINKEVKLTYGSLDEKKKMNKILDEIESLNLDRVDDRNKMIEVIKKHED